MYKATFKINETVTGDSSKTLSGTTIHPDRIGFKGVTSFEFDQTKQIGMV